VIKNLLEIEIFCYHRL